MSRKMKPKHFLDTFQGFPICPSYKYLGLQLTNKLSMLKQLDYIKNKSQLIHQKLSPLLYNSELDTRKSLWQVFIQPLIEFILPLYKWETSISNIQKADTVIRGTFKLFTGLKKNTANDVVDFLSGYNFPRRSQVIQEISFCKWSSRKKGEKFQYNFLPEEIKEALNYHQLNRCKRMPAELVQYINTFTSICQNCGVPNTAQHLTVQHDCKVPNLRKVLQLTERIQESKVSRRESLTKIKNILKPLLAKVQLCINTPKKRS